MTDVAAIYPVLFRAGWNVSHISMEEISGKWAKSRSTSPARLNAARILGGSPRRAARRACDRATQRRPPARAKPAVDAASPGGPLGGGHWYRASDACDNRARAESPSKAWRSCAISSEWIRARRPGDLRSRTAVSRVRSVRRHAAGSRYPHRRLRAGRLDARRTAVRLSRHQDLHRRAESPARCCAGRPTALRAARWRCSRRSALPSASRKRPAGSTRRRSGNRTRKSASTSCAADGCRMSRTGCPNFRTWC